MMPKGRSRGLDPGTGLWKRSFGSFPFLILFDLFFANRFNFMDDSDRVEDPAKQELVDPVVNEAARNANAELELVVLC